MSTADDLARRIESHAAISAVPGQLDALEQIAHEVRELGEKLHGEALVQQTALKGMSVEEGAAVLELGPPRELVIAYVHAAREMLGDAPNYSETRIDFPAVSMEFKAAGEFERYILTVQRAGKLTPHEARKKAEAEAEALRDVGRRIVEAHRQGWTPILQDDADELTRLIGETA